MKRPPVLIGLLGLCAAAPLSAQDFPAGARKAPEAKPVDLWDADKLRTSILHQCQLDAWQISVGRNTLNGRAHISHSPTLSPNQIKCIGDTVRGWKVIPE